jgi:hypothetical protein
MANQIQATVYQIDGSPLTSPTEISFLTSDIMIKEATLPIAAVNAAIFYYPNTSNKLGSQVFYVSETLSTLLTAANVGNTTQVQATVIQIDEDPQVPAGVQYTFPASNISIWENIDAAAGVNADIHYKNKTYSVAETEDSLVADANVATIIPSSLNYGLFAQTANSTPVTNTTVETTLINGGVGTLSVPANGFSIGDSFRAVFGGVLNSANNQTIRVRVKTGSVVLLDSGAQPITNITNNIFSLNIDFTIRQLGGAGVASVVTLGGFHYTKTVNGVVEGFAFNNINNTTFSTTISNTLDVTIQWGAANAGNSIYSDIFILNKTY